MFIKVKYTYIFSHHNTRSPANQWIKLQELVLIEGLLLKVASVLSLQSMVKVMTKQSAPFDIEIANQPFDKEIAGQGVRRCCCHCHAETSWR